MRYFAYGSNMDSERMKKRGAGFTERVHATLPGYILRFNKITTGTDAKHKEGKGNVVKRSQGRTEGAL